MRCKLNTDQFSYLNDNLFDANNDVRLKSSLTVGPKYFIVTTDTETVDEIRDWANEELIRVGFDKNYQLTVDGRMLQDIADIFFTNNV